MKKILSILGVLFISLSASAQYKIGNYDLSTNSYFYRIPTAYALLSEDIEAHIGTIYLYFVQMQDKLPTIGVRLEYNGGVYKNFTGRQTKSTKRIAGKAVQHTENQ